MRSGAFSWLLLAAPAVAAGEANVPARPDFSAVTSVAAAKKLVKKGELVAILLFPAELGGHADPENIGYVTPQAAAGRALAIATLTRMVQEGTLDHMTVEPDYRGDSVVPTRIRMAARRKNRKGSLAQTIEVW